MTASASASEYFNANWKRYQQALTCNTLYHNEMMSTLNEFLLKNINASPFSFVDAGCGDASAMIPVLNDKNMLHYTGIDGAKDVLVLAEDNLKDIHCQKEFICADLLEVAHSLQHPVDVIFSSYAIHHLTTEEKINFLKSCQDKLTKQGYLIMVDGVLKPGQSRDEWLVELGNRIQTSQMLSDEEMADRMQHPKKNDYPEEVETFANIAKEQQWSRFDVLFQEGIFAFMVFSR